MKEDLDGDIFDLESVSLDRAWNDQARLYWTYSSKLADAREVWEQAKRERDLVYAELTKDVCLHPSKYDLVKATVEVVKQTVTICKSYQKAEVAVIEAKHDVDTLVAFVEALDQRKHALESKVKLMVAGLYAEPTAPKGEEAREKVKDMSKREIRNRTKIREKV
jgi:hypothetical protein